VLRKLARDSSKPVTIRVKARFRTRIVRASREHCGVCGVIDRLKMEPFSAFRH